MGVMTYDLERFLAAQEHVYEGLARELRAGRKTSHWMWFIFPQIAGLGDSDMSRRYAIQSLDEARAYVDHPLLGERLRECVELVLVSEAATAEAIFGPTDAKKLRSSVTLFHRASPDEPLFWRVLERFYDGWPDEATDALLVDPQRTPGDVGLSVRVPADER